MLALFFLHDPRYGHRLRTQAQNEKVRRGYGRALKAEGKEGEVKGVTVICMGLIFFGEMLYTYEMHAKSRKAHETGESPGLDPLLLSFAQRHTFSYFFLLSVCPSGVTPGCLFNSCPDAGQSGYHELVQSFRCPFGVIVSLASVVPFNHLTFSWFP